MARSGLMIPAAVALLCGVGCGVYLLTAGPGRYSRFLPGETLQMRQVVNADAAAANRAPKFTPKEAVALDKSQTPPKAVAVEATHKFGAMDPFSTAEHTFIIRNEGLSTLTLHAGPTTCKCTACVVKQSRVAPGSEAQIDVAWRTVGRQENFRHSATVYTNDPENPEINLVIQGAVRTHLGAEPPDFTLPRVNPLDSTVARTLLYSQAWEAFSISNFTSTMPGVTFKTTPATTGELKEFGAKAGYAIEVTLPKDLPSGTFRDSIRFEVRKTDASEEKPIEFEIGLEGKVLRRLTLQGNGVFPNGTIMLDPVDSTKGVKKRFLMKVHDTQLELPVERIKCEPEFVTVQITPYLPEGKQVGLYYLDLIIPPKAPPTARLVDNPGTIEIDFDHPRAEDLRLKLQFVVSSAE